MNTSIKTALSALALTALVAGPAAANLSGQSLNSAIQSAVSTGNVNVVVEDGVATLFGWVDSTHTENAAKQAALSFDHVDSIVDRIAVSR